MIEQSTRELEAEWECFFRAGYRACLVWSIRTLENKIGACQSLSKKEAFTEFAKLCKKQISAPHQPIIETVADRILEELKNGS